MDYGGHVGIPANSFSSIIGVESGCMPSSLQNQLKYDFRSTPNHHPHSLPDVLTNNSPSSMAAASLNGRMPERVGNRQFKRFGGSVSNDNVWPLWKCKWFPCHSS
ncbi:hypothetical protein Hdeb2414_s0028g00699471 [Helianthus debilis subsp. tardiflorus]